MTGSSWSSSASSALNPLGWQTVEVGSRQTSPARYDAIADWYVDWTAGWPAGFVCDPSVGLLADRLDGERWLDVACGVGRTSRELARRGAAVVGVDLSAGMIGAAEAEEATKGLGITYRAADVTEPGDWWDGAAFDGAVCEMAFMDIDDLDGTIRAVASVVRRGALFCVSMVHPCCPTTETGLSAWPPGEGYQSEGFWTSPDHNPSGVRVRVGSNHRTLATYLNSVLGSGFLLERVHEPAAPVPTYLVMSLRRV